MVYFIVRAPVAVLDKLQFAVGEKSIRNNQDYADFRHRLASINDIATIVVQRSTGRDEVIVQCLDAFESAHKKYIRVYLNENDSNTKRLHLSACRAVLTEMMRIYRTACSAKNDRVTKAVTKSYCRVIVDSAEAGCSATYFRELMSRVDKCQTYAAGSFLEEIEEQANILWYFILASKKPQGFLHDQAKHQASVTRTMSSSLRRLTVDGNENIIARFAQIASNTDIEYDVSELSPYWLTMLDQAILIYMMWLIESEPADANRYLSYLRTYSVLDGDFARPLLCDSRQRLIKLIESDKRRRMLAGISKRFADKGKEPGIVPPNDMTAVVMGMDATEEASHTLAILIEMEYADVEIDSDYLPHTVRKTIVAGMQDMLDKLADPNSKQYIDNKIELAGVVSKKIQYYWQNDKWHEIVERGKKKLLEEEKDRQ